MRRPLLVQSISRRAPSSLALLLAGIVAVGGTALAPLLERSIEQHSLRTALATASDDDTRLTATATSDAAQSVSRSAVVDRLTGILDNPAADRHYGPAAGSVVTDSRFRVSGPSGVGRGARIGYLANGCSLLRISAAACPSRPGEAAIGAADAATLGVGVGDAVQARRIDGSVAASFTVVAVYPVSAATVDFGTGVPDVDLPDGVDATGLAAAPLFVIPKVLETAFDGDLQFAQVVRHLDRTSVDLDHENEVRDAVSGADQAALLAASGDIAVSDVDSVLDDVDGVRRTSAVTVGLAAIQLVAITCVGLGVLVRAVTTARAPEFAVGSLRGLSAWQVARSATGTTAVLLLLAVPLGWLAAAGLGVLVAPVLVGTDAALEPLRWPVLAAAFVAFVGSLVTALVASRRAVRTPVSSLLHRSAAADESGRWTAAVELATVAVAVLTAVQLVRGGALESAGQSGLGLVGPALVAVGAGVVVARVATLVLRRGVRRVPRGVPGLLAGRRLAHAPGVLRGAVVLVAGAALAASAADVAGIAERNRVLRAGQEVGAAEVLTVQSAAGVDLRTAVDRADPGGHVAMAAVQRTDTLSGVRLVAVDSDRYAAVASVDPRWTDLAAGAVAARLHPPTAPPLSLTGSELTVQLADIRIAPVGELDDTGTARVLPDTTGVGVETDLVAVVDDGSRWQQIDLGEPTTTDQTFTAAVPCRSGCALIGLTLATAFPKATYYAQFRVTAVATDRQPAGASATALTGSGRWIAPALLGSDPYGLPQSAVQAASDGLHVTMTDPVGDPTSPARVLVATRPAELPVIAGVGFGQNVLELSAPAIGGTGLDGADVAYEVQGTSAALPRVGAGGVLIDLRIALAASDPSALGGTVSQVWVSDPTAVPALTRSLAAQRVTVTGTQTAAGRERELAALGPARAVLVAEVAAGVGLALALLVALAGLLAAGRNRLYELASLRAAGVRDRTLRRSVLLELGVLLGVAAVLGAAIGLGVAGLTTAGLSFYAGGGGPPLDLHPDLTGAGLVVAAAVVAVVAVSLGTAVVLVRSARPARLRESIR